MLSLFHRDPGSLPPADLALGQALADVATIGILSERTIRHGEVLSEQLQAALNSGVIIEQAKGVLANHARVGMDTAFDRLRRHARTNNVRLVELARQVVADEVDLDTLLAAPTPAQHQLGGVPDAADRPIQTHRRQPPSGDTGSQLAPDPW